MASIFLGVVAAALGVGIVGKAYELRKAALATNEGTENFKR
jgi:hypothetical protein